MEGPTRQDWLRGGQERAQVQYIDRYDPKYDWMLRTQRCAACDGQITEENAKTGDMLICVGWPGKENLCRLRFWIDLV